MFGAIAGDIIGSPYEYLGYKGFDFPLFSENSRYTDDTVLHHRCGGCPAA